MLILRDGRLNQHRAEQNKIAEPGMDHIAMNAHMAQAGGHRDRLMRQDPELAGADLDHFHRKSHRWVNGADAFAFKYGDDTLGSLIYTVTSLMEFKIRY